MRNGLMGPARSLAAIKKSKLRVLSLNRIIVTEACETQWPSLAGSRAYGTVTEAMQDSMSAGYNTSSTARGGSFKNRKRIGDWLL